MFPWQWPGGTLLCVLGRLIGLAFLSVRTTVLTHHKVALGVSGLDLTRRVGLRALTQLLHPDFCGQTQGLTSDGPQVEVRRVDLAWVLIKPPVSASHLAERWTTPGWRVQGPFSTSAVG